MLSCCSSAVVGIMQWCKCAHYPPWPPTEEICNVFPTGGAHYQLPVLGWIILSSFYFLLYYCAQFWRVANKTGGFVISRLPPRPQSDSAVYFANNENYNCTIAKSPHHFQVSLWRDNQQSFRIRKYVDFTVSTKKRILTWPVQWNKIWIPDLKMNSMTLAWEAASTVLTVFTAQIADTMNWGARIIIFQYILF